MSKISPSQLSSGLIFAGDYVQHAGIPGLIQNRGVQSLSSIFQTSLSRSKSTQAQGSIAPSVLDIIGLRRPTGIDAVRPPSTTREDHADVGAAHGQNAIRTVEGESFGDPTQLGCSKGTDALIPGRVSLMNVRNWLYRLKRWLYRSGRPNWIAAALNRLSAAVHALGIAPNYAVTLEVRGRRSGRKISLPLVMVVVERERYLVSMLGADVDWVKNVKAADGHVVLRHGRREEVRLEEVPADRRAAVLKEYLKRAPGARPHIPVPKNAPLSEFEQVAGRFPVFRVVVKTVSMSAE